MVSAYDHYLKTLRKEISMYSIFCHFVLIQAFHAVKHKNHWCLREAAKKKVIFLVD